MAELEGTNAIVPVQGEFVISVNEYDAAGKVTALSVNMPTSPDFKQWSLMQQVVMLKKGAWSKSPISEVLWGVTYANSLGLDVMQGDVYPIGEGRIATSNKAKIKLALGTGRIRSIETTITELADAAPAGCAAKKDLECTATIEVQGFTKPIVRKARLSRWFKAKNPNWVGNPEHMLELNTVAHACEYVAPGGTEADELPALEAKA